MIAVSQFSVLRRDAAEFVRVFALGIQRTDIRTSQYLEWFLRGHLEEIIDESYGDFGAT
jgi:hypothetical protein